MNQVKRSRRRARSLQPLISRKDAKIAKKKLSPNVFYDRRPFIHEDARGWSGGSVGSGIALLSLKNSSYHNLLKMRVTLSGQQYPLPA
jgi:hypothetical protein